MSRCGCRRHAWIVSPRTPRNSGSHDSSDFGQSFPDYGYKNLESWFCFLFIEFPWPIWEASTWSFLGLPGDHPSPPSAEVPKRSTNATTPRLQRSPWIKFIGGWWAAKVKISDRSLKSGGIFRDFGKDFLDYVGFAMNYLFILDKIIGLYWIIGLCWIESSMRRIHLEISKRPARYSQGKMGTSIHFYMARGSVWCFRYCSEPFLPSQCIAFSECWNG